MEIELDANVVSVPQAKAAHTAREVADVPAVPSDDERAGLNAPATREPLRSGVPLDLEHVPPGHHLRGGRRHAAANADPHMNWCWLQAAEISNGGLEWKSWFAA
jgi:hypothetical protein